MYTVFFFTTKKYLFSFNTCNNTTVIAYRHNLVVMWLLGAHQFDSVFGLFDFTLHCLNLFFESLDLSHFVVL